MSDKLYPEHTPAEIAQAQECIRAMRAELALLRAENAKLKRYPFEPICLNCGALEPCITEADLKPGDPGMPCTFDPTPRQLFDENARLRAVAALAERSLPWLEDVLDSLLRVREKGDLRRFTTEVRGALTAWRRGQTKGD